MWRLTSAFADVRVTVMESGDRSGVFLMGVALLASSVAAAVSARGLHQPAIAANGRLGRLNGLLSQRAALDGMVAGAPRAKRR